MANRKVTSDSTISARTLRASISFPENQYAVLERIAQQQRVSLAWVVRTAVQEYIENKIPLISINS